RPERGRAGLERANRRPESSPGGPVGRRSNPETAAAPADETASRPAGPPAGCPAGRPVHTILVGCRIFDDAENLGARLRGSALSGRRLLMNRFVGKVTTGGLFALMILAIPVSLHAQLPASPRRFVDFLDTRCYQIPNQPPLNLALRLDHLN